MDDSPKRFGVGGPTRLVFYRRVGVCGLNGRSRTMPRLTATNTVALLLDPAAEAF